MSNTQTSHEKTTMVYACSGCADVGSIADQIGRKLRRDGFATPKLSCLAGIGAGIKPFIDAAKAADQIIAIDGCEVECAKKILENAGISAKTMVLTQQGLEKGKTPLTPEIVDRFCNSITLES